jgi:hypothetical protein
LYAPWIPTVVFQAGHTGAPWASAPTLSTLAQAPEAVFGSVAAALLLALPFGLVMARRAPDRRAVLGVLGIAVLTTSLAWISSQIEPAWAVRYLAIVVAPIILAAAGAAAMGGRLAALALAGVAVIWCGYSAPAVKSNVRSLARSVGPHLSSGDIVLSSAPEDVPVLRFYLPTRVRYLTPWGATTDPRVTDWRDLLPRMRAAPTERTVARAIETLAPGQHLVLVRPSLRVGSWRSPLDRVIRMRDGQIAMQAARDPRLRLVDAESPPEGYRSRVSAEVYVKLGRDRAASR